MFGYSSGDFYYVFVRIDGKRTVIVSRDVTFYETPSNAQSNSDVNESTLKSVFKTDKNMQFTTDELNEDNHDHDKERKIGGPKMEDDSFSGLPDMDVLTYYLKVCRFERFFKPP